MFRVAICTDDLVSIESLQIFLKKISNNISFVFDIQYFKSGEKLIQYCNCIGMENVHILILDMDIEDGVNWLDTAKSVRSCPNSQDVQIIFISHNISNILESFEIRPFQCFLKPITYDLFKEKMITLCNYIFSSFNRFLIIKSDENQVVLRIKEIRAIVKAKEILSQKRLIVFTEQEEYILKGSLTEYSQKLGRSFVHIHRSVIVNLEYVQMFNTNNVIMINQQSYPIGRTKLKLLKEAFSSYSFENRGG
ncbi:LytR/AlgR family response regulator transcription factor [Bacillus sp. FJAT-28004]|uniref:LytR/AlgR family response regulator transcription factor n=1 Tax=Bacillus sp. FJAT-28004 TaxID=1679165 RepID=UPI0006B63913|nr:LytTR family transcriptional regulator DNA-binding domain-containing protein [Bacillus sp. FJAT-28004]